MTLLNDPSYVESARVFAEDILNQRKLSAKERINWAFQRALSRPASLTEQSIVFALFNQHQNDFEKDKDAAQLLASSGEKEAVLGLNESDLAAWTSVARTVLNLHEVISIGATRIAVIGAIMDSKDPFEASIQLLEEIK